MENPNYNQPAFPTVEQVNADVNMWSTEAGMSLLDYFAAKVAPVLIGATMSNPAYTVEACAKESYEYAAAMLRERSKYIK